MLARSFARKQGSGEGGARSGPAWMISRLRRDVVLINRIHKHGERRSHSAHG